MSWFCNLPKAWCAKCFDEATSVLEFNTLRLNTHTDLATVWLKKQNPCKSSTADRHLVTQKRKPPFVACLFDWIYGKRLQLGLKYAMYRIETFSMRLKLKIDRGRLGNRTRWLSSGSRRRHTGFRVVSRMSFADAVLHVATASSSLTQHSQYSVICFNRHSTFFLLAYCARLHSLVAKNRPLPL